MTEQQKQYVREIEEEIRQQPGGKNFKIYMSIEIVRLVDTVNDNYRLYTPCKGDGKKVIRMKLITLFREMCGGN